MSLLSRFWLGFEERKHKVLKLLPENSELILVLGSGGTPEAELPVSQRLGTAALQRCIEEIRLWNLDPRKTLVFSLRGKEGYPSQSSVYADFANEQVVNPL